MKCEWHLCDEDVSLSNFCTKDCRNKHYVDRRRRKLKLLAIFYKGGKCESCGYDNSIWALQFHHKIPSKKEFSLSSGNTRSWKNIKSELEKCFLLCANCHAEEHQVLESIKRGYVYPEPSLVDEARSQIFYEKNGVHDKEGAETLQGLPKSLVNCKICNIKTKNKRFCSQKCYRKSVKSNRPLKKDLIDAFKTHKTFLGVGRAFNVSDNAVRKWCRKYNLPDKVMRKSRPQT